MAKQKINSRYDIGQYSERDKVFDSIRPDISGPFSDHQADSVRRSWLGKTTLQGEIKRLIRQ